MNIKTFKAKTIKPIIWSRKGKCPSCGVITGSKHNKKCKLIYIKNNMKYSIYEIIKDLESGEDYSARTYIFEKLSNLETKSCNGEIALYGVIEELEKVLELSKELHKKFKNF